MVKFRITIDRDSCIDCGISTGRCPTHSRSLARLIDNYCEKISNDTFLGSFSEDLFSHIMELAGSCPTKAIKIDKIMD